MIEMLQLAYAFKTEVKLSCLKMIRYPVQTVTSILVLYLVFIGTVYGSRFLVGADVISHSDKTKGAIDAITGYLLWFVSLFAVDSMSQNIAEEAQTGTLEQLYLSRWPLSVMLFLRFVAALMSSVVLLIPVVSLMMFSTGAFIGMQLLSAVPVILLACVGLCGMGYVLGALTLLFKKIGNTITLVQFGFLFLCLPPLRSLPSPLRWVAVTLPLTQGVDLVRALVTGASGATVAHGLLLLAFTSTGWILAGLAVFQSVETIAKNRALLGHY